VETTTFPVEATTLEGRFELLSMSRVQICSYFSKIMKTFVCAQYFEYRPHELLELRRVGDRVE
jgi:hypothetical protein